MKTSDRATADLRADFRAAGIALVDGLKETGGDPAVYTLLLASALGRAIADVEKKFGSAIALDLLTGITLALDSIKDRIQT